RLKRVDERRALALVDGLGEGLQEEHRQLRHVRVAALDRAPLGDVDDRLVEQDQGRLGAEQPADPLAARRRPLLPGDEQLLVGAPAAELVGELAPERRDPAPLDLAPALRVEVLAREHGDAHRAGIGKLRELGHVRGRRRARSQVIEREQAVGLASAERGAELEHAIAGRAREPPPDVEQQLLDLAGEIGRAEELARVAVDARARALERDLRQVGGVGAHRQVAGGDVGVRLDDVGPGAERVGAGAHRVARLPGSLAAMIRTRRSPRGSLITTVSLGRRPRSALPIAVPAATLPAAGSLAPSTTVQVIRSPDSKSSHSTTWPTVIPPGFEDAWARGETLSPVPRSPGSRTSPAVSWPAKQVWNWHAGCQGGSSLISTST